MQQYLAKLIFNIVVDSEKNVSQFDEQIRLIEAQNLESAFIKARSIGKHEESVFLDHKNKTITWKFIDVTELYQLNEFRDGEQLFSVTHDEENTASFLSYIREKSMAIQVKNLTFA
jgi:glutathionylspermidine synthase